MPALAIRRWHRAVRPFLPPAPWIVAVFQLVSIPIASGRAWSASAVTYVDQSQTPLSTVWVRPGTQISMNVRYKNTGTTTWNNTGGVSNPNFMELRSVDGGCSLVNGAMYDGTWINRQRIHPFDTSGGSSIPPGAIATFSFTGVAPGSSGDYVGYQWVAPWGTTGCQAGWHGVNFSLRVDGDPPVTTKSGGPPNGTYVTDQSITFDVNETPPSAGVKGFCAQWDNATPPAGPCQLALSGAVSFSSSNLSPYTPHTLYVVAYDNAYPTSNVSVTNLGTWTYSPDHVISASASANGSISPSGTVGVQHGGSQTFTITPHTCYRVADVLVDGVSVGPVTSYPFTNVTSNHTISASFTVAPGYTINASAGANGSISPSGSIGVPCGGSQTFNITPSACYSIQDVLIDGVSVGAITSHTFTNVQKNYSIAASFADITPGAPGQPTPDPSGCTDVNTFAFSWGGATPASCIAHYDYRIDGGSAVSVGNVLSVSGIAAPGAGSHTFAVRAVSGVGTAGPWSASATFCYTLPELAFRPKPNGYKYANPPYPLCCYPSLPRDPTWDMFVHYFGHQNVYLPGGFVRQDAWRYFNDAYVVSGRSGYCLGFSATSIINYLGMAEPYSGPYAMPSVSNLFNDGRAWPLWPWDDQSLSIPVIYYHATWTSNNVLATFRINSQQSPATIYEVLLAAFVPPQRPYTLILTGPRGVRHAVMPYSAYRSGNTVSVGIYDPDRPGINDRALQINLPSNTWSYPMVDGSTWSGTATSHTLAAIPVDELLKAGVPNWNVPVMAAAVRAESTAVHQPLVLLGGEGVVSFSDSLGNPLPDSLDSGIEPIVPVMAAGYDSLPHGFELDAGSPYKLTFHPLPGDTEGVAVLVAGSYFAAQAHSDSLELAVSSDASTIGVRSGGSDSLRLDYAHYVSDEQHLMHWDVASPSGRDSLTLSPTAAGAAISVPPDGQPISYALKLQFSGDSSITRTMPAITMLPGQTHSLDSLSWQHLDSTAVTVNVTSVGDTATRRYVFATPALTVVEGTPDSAYTAVYIELQPPWSTAQLVPNSIRVDTMGVATDVVITDIDGDGLPELAARFDRQTFRSAVFDPVEAPFATGTCVLGPDTVLFSAQVPREFHSTGIDGHSARTRLAIQVPPPGFGSGKLVSFDVPHRGRWRIVLYDVQGRRVQTLFDHDVDRGHHALPWEPMVQSHTIHTGVYFVRLTDGVLSVAARAIILR